MRHSLFLLLTLLTLNPAFAAATGTGLVCRNFMKSII